MTCGIYKITNKLNNKVYIGQSVNIEERLNAHRLDLINGEHSNPYLQNSYNKNGLINFKLEIIEECSEEKLNKREQYWIDFHGGIDSEANYNMGAVCGGRQSAEVCRKKSIALKGRPLSEQNKKNLSLSRTGKYAGENHAFYGKQHTAESKQKMSEAKKGEKSVWFGKHHSEETKLKMSQASKGKIMSEGTKLKMRENHYDCKGENHPQYGKTGEKSHWFGKKHSPEALKKMSDARKKYYENKRNGEK